MRAALTNVDNQIVYVETTRISSLEYAGQRYPDPQRQQEDTKPCTYVRLGVERFVVWGTPQDVDAALMAQEQADWELVYEHQMRFSSELLLKDQQLKPDEGVVKVPFPHEGESDVEFLNRVTALAQSEGDNPPPRPPDSPAGTAPDPEGTTP